MKNHWPERIITKLLWKIYLHFTPSHIFAISSKLKSWLHCIALQMTLLWLHLRWSKSVISSEKSLQNAKLWCLWQASGFVFDSPRGFSTWSSRVTRCVYFCRPGTELDFDRMQLLHLLCSYISTFVNGRSDLLVSVLVWPLSENNNF